MFRENSRHTQTELFSFEQYLNDHKLKRLEDSEAYQFYRIIFRQIPEADFAVLYSQEGSRPNAPVNSLVAALILLHRRGWTYHELFEDIDYNLKTRAALGLWDMNTTPFSRATLFNFQNRLANYWVKTGENLLERVFDALTEEQLETLKLQTDIQRADSFLAASNIRDYSRLQLLIEVLQRFVRVLKAEDRKAVTELVKPYSRQSSGQYLYHLKADALSDELARLGPLYQQLLIRFEATYGDREIYRILKRVFTEHFTVSATKIQVRPAGELSSDSLQSPDDPEATYRRKGSQESRGQVIHVSETCHPDNQLNLITDVSVAANNTDDSVILAERIGRLKERTPVLKELHVDAGYASDDTEQTLQAAEIALIQTAIKGRTAAVPLTVTEQENGKENCQVTCPRQTVKSERTPQGWKAEFDRSICGACSVKAQCPATVGKKGVRRFYFNRKIAQRHARWRRWAALPDNRRTLRANVEATVREMQGAMSNGKLKVRGAFATETYALLRAIGVNFGRISRFLPDPNTEKPVKALWQRVSPILIRHFIHILHRFHALKSIRYAIPLRLRQYSSRTAI